MGPRTTALSGKLAEDTARRFLLDQGLQLLQQNFQRRLGEIDLIFLHDGTLVFVEVRFRLSTQFSAPALTVDARKQRKLVRAAALFLTRHPEHADRCCRFDVVAVTGAGFELCEWITDAFRPGDSAL